jgi:PIN domain nuclease of toxin-antitoxin system
VILIVDAHAALWALGSPDELSTAALSAITSPSNDVVVSVASIWEIAVKRAAGRLEAPPGIAQGLEELGFTAVPITAADAERAAGLPMHHRDPFDRMVIAQALRLDAVLVTRDAALTAYGVEVLEA